MISAVVRASTTCIHQRVAISTLSICTPSLVLVAKGVTLKFQIDTGATCSTLKHQDYMKLSTERLQPSTARLRLYDKSVIKPIGAITLRCMTDSRVSKLVHFEVVENAPTSLLSGRASEALKLLQFSQEHVVHTVKTAEVLTKDYILEEYKDVFNGLGQTTRTLSH